MVAICAKSADNSHCDIGKIGVVPEGFTGVYIRQVYLDKRDLNCQQRIAQRHAGMGKGCGVDQDKICISACLMDSINQEMLCVGLQMAERNVSCGGLLF